MFNFAHGIIWLQTLHIFAIIMPVAGRFYFEILLCLLGFDTFLPSWSESNPPEEGIPLDSHFLDTSFFEHIHFPTGGHRGQLLKMLYSKSPLIKGRERAPVPRFPNIVLLLLLWVSVSLSVWLLFFIIFRRPWGPKFGIGPAGQLWTRNTSWIQWWPSPMDPLEGLLSRAQKGPFAVLGWRRQGWEPTLPDQISLRGGIHRFQTKFLFGVGSRFFCKKYLSPIDPFNFLCMFIISPMRRIPLFLLDLFYLQCQRRRFCLFLLLKKKC